MWLCPSFSLLPPSSFHLLYTSCMPQPHSCFTSTAVIPSIFSGLVITPMFSGLKDLSKGLMASNGGPQYFIGKRRADTAVSFSWRGTLPFQFICLFYLFCQSLEHFYSVAVVALNNIFPSHCECKRKLLFSRHLGLHGGPSVGCLTTLMPFIHFF